MRVTESDLRANYESLETERLLELRARNTLTDVAKRVLEQVLDGRSVTTEQREVATSEIQQQLRADDAMLASLASVGERVGAQLIDYFVALTVLLLAFFGSLVAPWLVVAGAILFFSYLLLADGLPNGQSLGKRALGISVVDRRTHRECTYVQSFLRNLLGLLLGFIDWLFIFGRLHQRLGDVAANTIVVRRKDQQEVRHDF